MTMPDKIGPYKIINHIATGGMGHLWHGVLLEKETGRIIERVAVKQPLSAGKSLEERKRFEQILLQEASICEGFEHTNLVKLKALVPDETGCYCIVYELLEGVTLDKKVCSFRDNFDLLTQLVQGLDYIHKRNVVHNDLKPANIMVTLGNRLKILDFGIAQSRAFAGLAGNGGLTPNYAAPERWFKEEFSIQSDVFSLAIIAFELFFDTHPFANNVQNIRYESPNLEELIIRGKILPFEIDAWQKSFLKALSKNPADRHPQAIDFIQELQLGLDYWPGKSMVSWKALYKKCKDNHSKKILTAALFLSLVGGAAAFVESPIWKTGKDHIPRIVKVQIQDRSHKVKSWLAEKIKDMDQDKSSEPPKSQRLPDIEDEKVSDVGNLEEKVETLSPVWGPRKDIKKNNLSNVPILDYLPLVEDPVLRQYLLDHFDFDRDGKINDKECLEIHQIVIKGGAYSKFKVSTLNGLEHFKNLQLLVLDQQNLSVFPKKLADLEGLVELQITGSRLGSLEKLPPNLESLDLSGNIGLNIGFEFPATLKTLRLSFLRLTWFDYDLPHGLEELDISDNHLEGWSNLNRNLKVLNVARQQPRLRMLYELPPFLEHLDCRMNEIERITELPSSLKKLDCQSNWLTHLPVFHSGLERLSCNDNRLVYVPEIPESIKYIDLSNNCLRFPPILKSTYNLENFYMTNNHLSQEQVNHLQGLYSKVPDFEITEQKDHCEYDK